MKISLHTKTCTLRPYNCCFKQFSTNSFKEIQCRWLTNTALTSRLKRRCPGLQWPPCSSSKQNTQDGTYVLQPPGTRNKQASSPFRSNATSLLSCSVVLCWWAVSCVLFSALLPPTVSGDIAVTPASLSACLESAMTSPSGADTLVLLAFSLSMIWNFQLLLTDTACVSVIDFPFWHACRTSVSSHCFHPFHARWDHVYPLQTSKMLISGLFM